MGAPSSAFLKNLSLRRIRPRAQAAVAPLPVTTRFDQELTAELDTLQSLGTSGALGFVQFLDAAITTQKIALDSLVNISYRDDVDREHVDMYLENNIDILDACNFFMERIENLKKYADSLRVVPRFIDTNATTRALDHLDSCHEIEKQCKVVNKSLRKMLKQKLGHESELTEIMCGSKAMALMGCKFLELGLSFDSKAIRMPLMKQSQPMSCSWMRLLHDLGKEGGGSASEKKLQKMRFGPLMMIELQQTKNAAQELKEQVKGRKEKDVIKSTSERLKRSSRELEEGLEVIEGRVKDLYKKLIDVRMVLLGILSHA
ncbi:hypothetical protein TanjilG_20009 [Lupinus angustifolius]|uniref:Uncharacterized protein n=1 Tax=Lupinus angustifolius TaxID=3871 RepID=A0A4P1RBW0_LUPAN|nr:hypothetical protein TanjilG_20009 [Lupinus angustifolius]